MSPEMVAATFVPKTKAAMKLNSAAHATACAGVSTRVATTVAIELAASWNPLRKSNTSAKPTMMKTSQRIPAAVALGAACVVCARMEQIILIREKLAVLENDALQRVADVLASVDRFLDVIVKFFPLDHVQ